MPVINYFMLFITVYSGDFSMSVLKGLYYTKQHEWIKVDGDVAALGISDHAQELLGEITYVELPEVGMAVDSGGELAVVES